MKKIRTVIAAALIAVVSFSTIGCKTGETATDAQKAARVATVAQLAAFDGASIWLTSHPDDRQYFEAARTSLKLLLATDTINPADFTAALQGLPIKELQGPNGALIVGSAVILYDAYLRENVNLDANVYLRPVITAVAQGLDRALGPNQ